MANKLYNGQSKEARPNPGTMGGKPGGTQTMRQGSANWPKPPGPRKYHNKVGAKHIKNLGE